MIKDSFISTQLTRIANEFVDAVELSTGKLPTAPYDPDWPSECIEQTVDQQSVYWRPVERRSEAGFDGLERALEQDFPAQLRDFYSCFWSGSLPVVWGDRRFELLQIWNLEDEQNLLHNFLGHALEKRRVREPLTLFFAVIDEKRFLSCDVQTGVVVLEEVGGSRPEQVADNLAALLAETHGAEPQ